MASRYGLLVTGLVALVRCGSGGVSPAAAPGPVTGDPSRLAAAESLLAGGDTGQAIALLDRLADAWPALSDEGLAANLALQWIGRAPRWRDARRRSMSRAAELLRWQDPTYTQGLLLSAWFLERRDSTRGAIRGQWTRERREVRQQEWEARLDGLQRSGARPLLVGGARWLLAQDQLVSIDEHLLGAIPRQRGTRTQCLRLSGAGCAPPPEARSLRAIVLADTAMSWDLEAARENLRKALDTAWPFTEMAARTLAAVEVVFGTPESRLGAAASLERARAAERTRAELVAVLLDFGGRREAAESVMQERPEWFSWPDTVLAALGVERGLDPAVVWRTSWPLFLEPTNERRTVHRARVLAAGALARAIPMAYTSVFALDSVAATFVRYGLPVAVSSRVRWNRLNTWGDTMVVIPYLDPRTVETLVRVGGSARGPPPLDLALAARDPTTMRGTSGYVDRHFDALELFEHQVVRFVRDGRTRVEIHASRPDPRCDRPAAEQGFFLLDHQLALTRATRDSVAPAAPPRHAFALPLDPGQYVYSLEVLDQACRQAARARFALEVRAPAAGVTLSDLMLADTSGIVVAARVSTSVAAVIRPGLTVRAGDPMHFYWEINGVAADRLEPDRLEILFEVVDVGRKKVPVRQISDLARRVARAERDLGVRYRAPVPAGRGPIGMTLAVTLVVDRDGVYVARVVVRDRGTGTTLRGERAIYLTGAEEGSVARP